PNGQTLAGGVSDGTLHLWNVADGKQIDPLAGHAAAISCVTWSPAGDLVATSSLDNTLRLWDPSHRKNLAVLEGHSDAATGVALRQGEDKIVRSRSGGTA